MVTDARLVGKHVQQSTLSQHICSRIGVAAANLQATSVGLLPAADLLLARLSGAVATDTANQEAFVRWSQQLAVSSHGGIRRDIVTHMGPRLLLFSFGWGLYIRGHSTCRCHAQLTIKCRK